MPKKNVTINDLAVMVKHGFDSVDKMFKDGFDSVDKMFKDGFDAVDERFDEMDKRFTERFDGIEQRLVDIEGDVSYLKSRVEEIARTLDEHAELLEEHSVELKWIHKRIDEMTDPRSDKRMISYKEFTDLQGRVETLERKVAVKTK